ncbi:MAG TPA: NAD-dependent epimerase/dehydratase family protein, partial [Chlamydiales bacterium]
MLPHQKIIITGGAGFVGSNLAIRLKRQHPQSDVIALDNLYRRGSELALPRLKEAGVEFIHGDIRCKEDLASLGHFDLLIECSAEPSVRAGYGSDPTYLLHTNLLGTINCLEAVRKTKADFVFLSTSRVYSIPKIQQLPLEIRGKRFVLKNEPPQQGWSEKGITTAFSLEGPRSMYGATKLASELIL